MRLRIDSRESGGVTVLDLSGHLVFGAEAQALAARVDQLITDRRLHVLMNIRELTFIDSSGIGELMTSFSKLKNHGGALKLAHASQRFHEILRITRLLDVLEPYETEEAALARFDSPTEQTPRSNQPQGDDP